MSSRTRHGVHSPELWSTDRAEHGTRATSLVRMPAIWARTVARSWLDGIRDLYSRIP